MSIGELGERKAPTPVPDGAGRKPAAPPARRFPDGTGWLPGAWATASPKNNLQTMSPEERQELLEGNWDADAGVCDHPAQVVGILLSRKESE